MSWPPVTGSPVGFVEQGITTVVWGTDGMFVGYIVKSLRDTASTDVIYVENGVGLRAVRVMLMQGREFELTVVDDTRLTPPQVGNALTIIDPQSRISVSFVVTHPDASATRKAEGERVIRGVIDYLVDGIAPF